MANEMPDPKNYTGLSRKVIEYSYGFLHVIQKLKTGGASDADWAELEQLVDVKTWERNGVFTGPTSETFDWTTYKKFITQYGGMTDWEGTLRRITETPGLVYLELEERNTTNGVMDVSNTVTIYKFNDAGKLVALDVYVSPLEKRKAA